MVRNIEDIKAELRKLTSSKPVHAAAGRRTASTKAHTSTPSAAMESTSKNQ